MNVKLTDSADALALASTVLGISPDKIADQVLSTSFCGQLDGDDTVFLFKLAMRQRYSTRDAAEAVIERLNERAVSESLEGNSKFLISAEVVEDDGTYRIRISAHCLHPNGDGWRLAIPTRIE